MKQDPFLTKEEIDLVNAEGGIRMEDVLGEWMRLTQKPLMRGGDRAVFDAVVFKSMMKEEATSAVLMHSCKEIRNPSQILIAFTLGLWLGQSQEAVLQRQEEDLDS